MPRLTCICGPNGAGKSTLSCSLALQRNIFVIDTDNLAAQGLSPVTAGKAAIRLARQMISDSISFARESTLSSRLDFTLMYEAKAAGFAIELVYIRLTSPELAIQRVQARKARGGHDVPVADILRHYRRGFENLPKAMAIADEWIILDNSGESYRRQ